MPNLRTFIQKPRNLMALLLGSASLAACATPQYAVRSGGDTVNRHGQLPGGAGGVYKVGEPYQVGGIWYVPREQPNYDETGVASYYGADFHAKATANGEIFDMNALSAAHPTLPMPSIVEVTNLENGRKLNVRVNDRGPFVGGRVIDVSQEAARELGFERQGTTRVRVRYVGRAPLNGMDAPRQYAAKTPPAPKPVVPAPVTATPLPAAPVPVAPTPATYSPTPTVPPSARPLVVTPSTPPADEFAGMPTTTARIAPTATQPASATPTPIYSQPKIEPPVAPVQAAATTNGSSLYRVQAGAFGDAANAERAVSQLADAGKAVIEPVNVNGSTLYRVMLQASADEGEAWALRDQVAAHGFADARVIRPF